jgi:hypothetical protein
MATETFTADNLFAGDFDVVTDTATLITGQNLARGAVLGKITASGKLNLSLSAAADGSQTPFAILAAATDASGGDKTCPIYLSGEFNQTALTIGTAHTAATIKDGLRAKGIFLKTSVAA